MERFFLALQASIENKTVKSEHSFCLENGIDRRHFYHQKREPWRGYFEAGWLVPLIKECGVSASWLLTGRGTMYAQ